MAVCVDWAAAAATLCTHCPLPAPFRTPFACSAQLFSVFRSVLLCSAPPVSASLPLLLLPFLSAPTVAHFALFEPHEQIAIDREFFSCCLGCSYVAMIPCPTHTHTYNTHSYIYTHKHTPTYSSKVLECVSFFSTLNEFIQFFGKINFRIEGLIFRGCQNCSAYAVELCTYDNVIFTQTHTYSYTHTHTDTRADTNFMYHIF